MRYLLLVFLVGCTLEVHRQEDGTYEAHDPYGLEPSYEQPSYSAYYVDAEIISVLDGTQLVLRLRTTNQLITGQLEGVYYNSEDRILDWLYRHPTSRIEVVDELSDDTWVIRVYPVGSGRSLNEELSPYS